MRLAFPSLDRGEPVQQPSKLLFPPSLFQQKGFLPPRDKAGRSCSPAKKPRGHGPPHPDFPAAWRSHCLPQTAAWGVREAAGRRAWPAQAVSDRNLHLANLGQAVVAVATSCAQLTSIFQRKRK